MTKKTTNPDAKMAKLLALVLSDTYVLAIKTHGYHWNVTGAHFGNLHVLFEDQYNALTTAADAIAERIRSLGFYPDGSMESFLENTVIKEAGTEHLSAENMLKDLHNSYMAMHDRMLDVEKMADENHDIVTQDIITQQISANDKTMWFIRSHIEEK